MSGSYRALRAQEAREREALHQKRFQSSGSEYFVPGRDGSAADPFGVEGSGDMPDSGVESDSTISSDPFGVNEE